MCDEPFGIVVSGAVDEVRKSYERFQRQPVDWDLSHEPPDPPARAQTTILRPASVAGPGTFFGKARRTLLFEPCSTPGWWFDRVDLPGNLPILVSVRNVWNTNRNIVLRSGSPHNYMRMVEHIIALRLGMGIDNLMIRADSGDPPLFERGSMDIVEALAQSGIAEQPGSPPPYATVKEAVSVATGNGGFLAMLPCAGNKPVLHIDCAIDFPNAIGKQRIRFTLNSERFKFGAEARTNTTASTVLYCHTVGKLFADIRNLGYTHRNILIAGRRGYANAPRLFHAGKALEAVWHRALLDLLAAIALIDTGRFVGRVISYKSGHTPDVDMVKILYKYGALREFTPGGKGQSVDGAV